MKLKAYIKFFLKKNQSINKNFKEFYKIID